MVVESDGSTAKLSTRFDDGPDILTAEVALSPPYPLEAKIPLENLPFAKIREFFPALSEAGMELEVSGRAQVRASLFELENLRYRVETEQVLGLYRGITLGATSPFVIEGTREGFSVRDLTLVGEDTAIGIDGVVPLSRDGSVVRPRARGFPARASEAVVSGIRDSGRANVDIHVEGALPDPWLRGELSLEEASGRFGKILVENVEASAKWSDRALVLEALSGETLGGRFRVSGELPPTLLDVSTPIRLRFEASDLRPLSLVSREEPGLLEEADLRIAVDGDLRGSGTELSRWQGEGKLQSVRVTMRGLEIANEAPGSWSFESGRLLVSDFQVSSGETRLVLGGEVLLLEDPLSWTARASGKIDHEVSRLFLEDLGLVFTGFTDLDVRAEKKGAEPVVLAGQGGSRTPASWCGTPRSRSPACRER